MTICPIAVMVGCGKCLVFAVCPLKGLIGDHKKAGRRQSTQTRAETDQGQSKRP